MNASIISIGNELLNGFTTDTNTPWLCQKLLEKGMAVSGGWVVPDEHDRIVETLRQAAKHSELILVTGGLGPTDDDLTRQAVAAYLKKPLEFRGELLDRLHAFFEKLGRPMAEKNLSQTYIPRGSLILENQKGTAAGFWSEANGIKIAVMPGVPAEMKHMFEVYVSPIIDKLKSDIIVVNEKVRCFGLGESDLAQKLGSLMDRSRNPQINCTCGPGEVVLHISASAESKNDALEMIASDKKYLAGLLGNCIYGYNNDSLAEVTGRLLSQNRKTLAVAESCTGGLLCEMITDCPGASDYFLSGWVTYSNASKIQQIGVCEQLLIEHGAVSEQVARQMAMGAAQKSGSDIAVGITGIAGPGGGTEQKPVGLVFISLYINGGCSVQKYVFPAVNRQWIRRRAALTALNLLRMQLQV